MSSDTGVDETRAAMNTLWDTAFAAGRAYEVELWVKKMEELRECLLLTLHQEGGMH